MVHKHKTLKQPEWYQDTESSWSDVGEDARVWRTGYKGFMITVYPVKLIREGMEGWEYILNHPKKTKGDDWDSGIESYEGRHAPNPETAKRWAVNTVNEWE